MAAHELAHVAAPMQMQTQTQHSSSRLHPHTHPHPHPHPRPQPVSGGCQPQQRKLNEDVLPPCHMHTQVRVDMTEGSLEDLLAPRQQQQQQQQRQHVGKAEEGRQVVYAEDMPEVRDSVACEEEVTGYDSFDSDEFSEEEGEKGESEGEANANDEEQQEQREGEKRHTCGQQKEKEPASSLVKDVQKNKVATHLKLEEEREKGDQPPSA